MTQELKKHLTVKKVSETPYAIDVHWKTLQRKKFYIFNPHIAKTFW